MALIPALTCDNPPACRLLRKPRKPSQSFYSDQQQEEMLRLPLVPVRQEQSHYRTVEKFNKNAKQMPKMRFSVNTRLGATTYRTGTDSPPPTEESRTREINENLSDITDDSIDRKYVIDSRYREQTNLGTYVPSKSLTKPFRPRGPGRFPLREPIRNPVLFHNYTLQSDIDDSEWRYYKPPLFTLQSFLIDLSDTVRMPVEQVQQIMLSQYNYKKIQKLVSDLCIPKYPELSIQTMSPPETMPAVVERVPHRHLLLQMAALVKEQMSEAMQMDMKVKILPLPKFSPQYNSDEPAPHTEIVVYEASDAMQLQKSITISEKAIELQQADGIFAGPGVHHFQGSRRASSPFTADNEGVISPTDLTLLDALMNGATALSLKAHFLQQLPDLQPFISTLQYLNLSFNELTVIPSEIFLFEQLVVLKLRNNPIREIPSDIAQLHNLQVLIIPFCLLTHLPLSLFSLKKLQHLDVAYNKLTFLPSEIAQLKCLEVLNVEGNQLAAMPAGALRLKHLAELNVRRNFMHPVFWPDFTRNQPQRLMDLAATCFTAHRLQFHYKTLPPSVLAVLNSHSACDCCQGLLYGPGLRIIRPVKRIYNIKNLPFMFRCCSVHCYNTLLQGGDALQEALYGRSNNASSFSLLQNEFADETASKS